MACHDRSSSLTSSSHPFVLKAEEGLKKLKASVGTTYLTYETMSDAIKAVRRVYECIDDLLSMSSYQSGLSHMLQRRWVDKELDESINMLDLFSTSRDNLDTMKYQVQDIESAIRRGESATLKSRVRLYNQLVKKANNDLKKQVARKNESLTGDASVVISLLSETRDITISHLLSVFSFLSKHTINDRTCKWHLQRGIVLDVDLLGVTAEKLEIELEALFRHLIRCRVALLNICSS